MTSGFTKLDSGIPDSSLWSEPLHVRIVFVTMLADAGPDGVVRSSHSGLARRANVTPEQCEDALAKLSAPDPDSRTEDHEGRRIEEVEGGWMLLNHAKYRAERNKEDRREYQRELMRQRREHQRSRKRTRWAVSTALAPVSTCEQPLAVLAQAEAEAEASKRESEGRACARDPVHEEETKVHHGGEPLPDNWPLADLYRALKGTGKFDGLTPEALAHLAQCFPESKPNDPETIKELVLSASSLAEPIAAPYQWLNARLSKIEVRRTTAKAEARTIRKEFLDAI